MCGQKAVGREVRGSYSVEQRVFAGKAAARSFVASVLAAVLALAALAALSGCGGANIVGRYSNDAGSAIELQEGNKFSFSIPGYAPREGTYSQGENGSLQLSLVAEGRQPAETIKATINGKTLEITADTLTFSPSTFSGFFMSLDKE